MPQAPAPALEIWPIGPVDEVTLRELWRGYPDRCETVLPEEVHPVTLARLLAGGPGTVHWLPALPA